MHPIRTVVKYSLIPLRTIVQLGELYVGGGDQRDERAEAAARPSPDVAGARPAGGARQEAADAERRTRRRQGAKRASQSRARKAGPQASRRPKDLDDVALARKVESIIFRDDSVPKGSIDVNAADGVVWLRGEARTPEMIKELEREAAAIPEVKQVENLLHLPKTPAPTRADTPPSQQRTRSSTRRAPADRKVTTSVTEERLGVNGGGS